MMVMMAMMMMMVIVLMTMMMLMMMLTRQWYDPRGDGRCHHRIIYPPQRNMSIINRWYITLHSALKHCKSTMTSANSKRDLFKIQNTNTKNLIPKIKCTEIQLYIALVIFDASWALLGNKWMQRQCALTDILISLPKIILIIILIITQELWS